MFSIRFLLKIFKKCWYTRGKKKNCHNLFYFPPLSSTEKQCLFLSKLPLFTFSQPEKEKETWKNVGFFVGFFPPNDAK